MPYPDPMVQGTGRMAPENWVETTAHVRFGHDFQGIAMIVLRAQDDTRRARILPGPSDEIHPEPMQCLVRRRSNACDGKNAKAN